MTNSTQENNSLSAEGQLILTAARKAVAQAIERHRRLGESIVICRDGQVVVVQPEDIPALYDSDAATPQATSSAET